MLIIGKPVLSDGLKTRCREVSEFTLLLSNGNVLLNLTLEPQRAQRTALSSLWLFVEQWDFDS